MARLFTSGWENNTSETEKDWAFINAGTETISSSVFRSGAYAGEVTGLTSGTQYGWFMNILSSSGAESDGPIYQRVYLRYATLPSAENSFITFIDSSFSLFLYVTLGNDGALRLYDEDGQIGSASSALSANTWYMVELMYDRTGIAGSHIVRARLNGVQFAGATNRNLSTGYGYVAVGGNLNSEAQTTGHWYLDDYALNDSSGNFQNSYAGSGKVVYLRANAAGDNADWASSSGGSNYTNVLEVTPNDATDYNSSNTVGNIDDYNIDAPPAEIGATDTINVLQLAIRYRSAGIELGSDAEFKIRIKASASGTVEESGVILADSGNWVMNNEVSPTHKQPSLTLYDLPGASTTPWTKNDLSNAQIGIHLTKAGLTEAVQVSTLWLIVDFTPNTATTLRSLQLLGVGI